jgi:hypothetical protein
LGELIRASSNPNSWTLRLLLTQLYDPAADVCELAVRFLEEACEDKEVLQLVVEMQPMMDHLGEIGHPLLLKCARKSRHEEYALIYRSGSCRRPSASDTSMILAISTGKWIRGSTYVLFVQAI